MSSVPYLPAAQVTSLGLAVLQLCRFIYVVGISEQMFTTSLQLSSTYQYNVRYKTQNYSEARLRLRACVVYPIGTMVYARLAYYIRVPLPKSLKRARGHYNLHLGKYSYRNWHRRFSVSRA